MPKSQSSYYERSRTGQYDIRRSLRQRANQEVAAAREREVRPIDRVVNNGGANAEVGEIVVHVRGEGEVQNEAGRRAAQVAVVEPNRPNTPPPPPPPPPQQVQGEREQPPNNIGAEPREPIFDDDEGENNPYDNEHATSEEEDSDEEGDDILGDQRLYEGAPITVTESMVLVLNLMLNHNLTGSCMEDLLQLINFHCPPAGLHRLSYYKFRKFFKSGKVPTKKHFYCSVCSTALGGQEEQCPTCRVDTVKAHFVQLPLIPQLRELYKRPSFYNALQHRHARVRDANFIGDIYDGSVYQDTVRAGFLSEQSNISFTWYTDGAPVFKSRNYSIWPFLFMINELPYKMRTSRENILMAGLWFGPTKPASNLFLRSFLPDLRKLYRGVGFNVADRGDQLIEVKAIVLAGVCDIPAKSAFMNFTAHNGFHGCTVCETAGETYWHANDPLKHQHTFPYTEDITLRSIDNYEDRARQALETRRPVIGIKGPTTLHLFMPDLFKGTAIDPMHLVTGVTKRMLELHFDESFSKEPYSLRFVMRVATRELLKIKPPKFIHRKAQSVEEFNRWKASQIMAWLLYYSVPIYQNLMRLNYYHHYLKFVAAISLLNSHVVTAAMIEKAEKLLKEFVRDFQDLYHVKFCSINIHLLLHLPDCVRRLGPLWVYTCFPMENLNGLMLANIHGKTSVDSQVCNSFWKVLCQHRLLHAIPDGALKEFITKRKRSVKIQEQIAPGCYSVGKYFETGPGDQNIVRALREEHVNAGNVSLYYRLLKDRLIYVADRYERDLASKSSYVMYDHRGRICYGCIEVFVNAQCNCGEPLCACVTGHYAVIHEVRVVDNFIIPYHPDCTLTHIHRFVETNSLHVVPVARLRTVCVHMNTFDKMFLARPLNSYEVE